MEYNKIVAITGLTGLYELLTSKTDGAIVRSLDDNNNKFVSSRVHNFSHLESIEVYTTNENVNLVDVFKAMEESAEVLPDIKNNSAIKSYFEVVFPEMDFERVYASDMKKMIKWFDQLRGKVKFMLSDSSGESEKESDVKEQPVTVETNRKETPGTTSK